MKQYFKQLQTALLITTSLYAGSLMAHPGDHHSLNTMDQLAHYLSQPYHISGVIGIAVVIAGLMIWLARQRS